MPLGMLGKYERLDVLGHGVSGIVYLARDTLLNKRVALKEVDVQAPDLSRFLEEARVLDRLNHPNIVRVNNVDRIEGRIVIDMEYVRGQNLQEVLRAEGRLPVNQALDIASQVLNALHYAHSMQTVHRDIKPANILIGKDGVVKLVDFGLAEILATNAYAGGAGTYAYMAPEDFAEEDRSDHRSDLWAVGVTLFEMIAGRRPFEVAKPKDPFAWKRSLENDPPTPIATYLPDAPAGLQELFDNALAIDKRDRYENAADFRNDIIRLQSGQEVPSEEANKLKIGNVPQSALAVAEPAVADPVLRRVDPEPVPAKTGSLKLKVEPSSIDMGALHKGAWRSVKFRVRSTGLRGSIHGRIECSADWLSAFPEDFERANQVITLTANSGQAWETGDFRERVKVITRTGEREIPVRLTVLKPRPTFLQVAAWYVPLLLGSLLPALIVSMDHSSRGLPMIPSAITGSGMLMMMLLLIGIAADIGIVERVVCGLLTALMCFVLGVTLSTGSQKLAAGTLDAGVVGALLLLFMIVQVFTPNKWRIWTGIVAVLSLLLSGFILSAGSFQ